MTEDLGALETDLLAMIVEEITFGAPVEATTDLLLTELVDSLGVIRIVSWLEARLSIEIEPADVRIEHFQSVERMMQYLKGR